jgi:DNA polymerase elongation subunit (family B)
MQDSFKLLSFDTNDTVIPGDDDNKYKKVFTIQMFGVNEKGKTACINVKNYAPFFYVKVGDTWDESTKAQFVAQLSGDLGDSYANAITNTRLIQRKKLYGFDGGRQYNFIQLSFQNEQAMKKAKSLWYVQENPAAERKLNPDGYLFDETSTILYEAQIPPLLRLFHIKEISPSGWIALPRTKSQKITNKKTSCDYEFAINYKDIIPLPHKESLVPFKICSFDIEASSSHGDFPLPVKNYKKLATNIIDICLEHAKYEPAFLKEIVLTAFGLAVPPVENVDKVYPTSKVTLELIESHFATWIKTKPVQCKAEVQMDLGLTDLKYQQTATADEEGGEGEGGGNSTGDSHNEGIRQEDVVEEASARGGGGGIFSWHNYKPKTKSYKKNGYITDLLTDEETTRDTKLLDLTRTLSAIFPGLHGDNVTFIGSTFVRHGEDKPYLNHCIARDTCDPVQNAVIESYKTEKEVLLAWTKLIQKEDPDIIIGYNIFGFDYQFMYLRAKELGCERAFLQLSRKKNEVCLKKDWRTGKEGLEESTLVIASGQHDLKFAKMTGRLQIDLYNYLRRDYLLTQYKLDYVSGYFIGDGVKKLEHITIEDTMMTTTTMTKVYSKNLTGLENGSFINFEEEAHTTEPYKNGKKFEVQDINRLEGSFLIKGKEEPDIIKKKVRWGLAKDDVTPQDIFRMTNEGPAERAIIAKYCIQDCNLVHHLMRKIDVLTGYTEMAKLCSVPIDFLVMRGQSIKLTSYIAKKCREKGTLMPVIDKGDMNEGYEGATVLEPKCSLYLETPIACLDYGSLYPSSMISENISHDSKVLTREYDLRGNLIAETGEKDPTTGCYIYDNLPGYEYVDITYNTYLWRRKNDNPKLAMEKVKVGHKLCRYAQYPTDPLTGKIARAVMPAILEELLAARKATRKLIETQKDDFMKNILDKRQLSIKVTANSLYGQTGAKTSSFYEKDCAASTTAIGRKLLTYGKRVVEEAYADAVVPTKDYGDVHTDAECVYGDTDSVFFKFNLKDVSTGEPIIGQKALEITIELAQQAGELATKFLKKPHDLEYEKTFLPFCLLSKKRYVGMLYETDPKKCKNKSMGIVLKRRDNAPIVKDVYGGIIDILMKDNNIEKAVNFLKTSLQNIVDEKVGMDKLIITKSLRSGYKNPAQISHKVLADRIGRRDPGNKPSVGDRIPFVYIENPNRKALQGDRIETPEFILANKSSVKINYSHYIECQIMKPVQQLFALVLEQMKDFKKKKGFTLHKWAKELSNLRADCEDEEKYKDKEEKLRNKEVKALLFDPYLRHTNNMKLGNSPITNFWKSANESI